MTLNLSKIFAVISALIFTGNVLANPLHTEKNEAFTLGIVHTNDMHARFEETSQRSAACSQKDKEAGNCYGGFGRIATLVRQARNSAVPTIFLNAGDTYQGTVWYNIYKWKAVSLFLNLLAPDAISLGNHEFDDGVAGLLPFIADAKFPIVCANLDLSQEPALESSKLVKSTIITKEGQQIGVIGYLTPETKMLSTTENVIFEDEVEAIRKESKKLKEQGIKIIIALGHSGYDVDKKIAAQVEDIDLVIGGHTNTFLYNDKQPDIEIPEGLYPTEIVQKSGRKVYVVQAYAYTKYLGNFTANFNSDGEIISVQGNPILVDSSIQQASDVMDLINEMKPELDKQTQVEVGKTRVLLDGDSKSCRLNECNLGNLITDAMIDYNVGQYYNKNGWTDVPIAVLNGGSIRNSITRDNNDKIKMADVLSTSPFNNAVLKVNMTGDEIISMLEWGVHSLTSSQDTSNLRGEFLQVSGLQVTYNLQKPANSKVVEVFVRCSACRVPDYLPIQKNKTYNVLMNDFIHQGGDGFKMLPDTPFTTLDISLADMVVEYLKKRSPVYPGIEWRITYDNKTVEDDIVKDDTVKGNSEANAYKPIIAIILLPVITLILNLV